MKYKCNICQKEFKSGGTNYIKQNVFICFPCDTTEAAERLEHSFHHKPIYLVYEHYGLDNHIAGYVKAEFQNEAEQSAKRILKTSFSRVELIGSLED